MRHWYGLVLYGLGKDLFNVGCNSVGIISRTERREGGAGGAESDMEMICHSGAEIISPRSGKSVRNQIQRFVSQQMTPHPNYFISLSDADQDAQKIGKEETSNIYENAQSSRSEIMKICNKKNQ